MVGWTVKPLGDRAGEYSNTNTPDIDLVILERASPSYDIFYTDILGTRKYPLHRNIGDLKIWVCKIFSLREVAFSAFLIRP